MHRNSKSRAPKLLGEFGEGLVTYALLRQDLKLLASTTSAPT